jgi:CPA1 family monovalent cation:H+ antiporter
MVLFEWTLLLLLVAVVLTAVARRAHAPYPAFLAIGGALLALLPHGAPIVLDPQLALALFVAPVLLDAAFDTSVRDLRENWAPVSGLVLAAVGLTTAAVALVAHAIVPGLPWPAAIALGAIVAPPDAAAATAVLRHVRPPHRVMVVLEGESLLNDATALLIYKLAVGAAAAGAFVGGRVVTTMLVVVGGSILLGAVLAPLFLRLTRRVEDIPSMVVLQFTGCWGVWILAERLGLSAVLTIVVFAISVARVAPALVPARVRVPSYAVWDTAVFVMNVLAFSLVGLQLRPILERLTGDERAEYLMVAAAVLVTVIVARAAWVMSYTAVARWRERRAWARAAATGDEPPAPTTARTPVVRGDVRRPLPAPSRRAAIVVSWCGMRGIVTLAAALALPDGRDGPAFPYRDLLVLVAFCVVLGTLVVQGLTLRPLVQRLALRDDHPVEREVSAARAEVIRAAMQSLDAETDPELAEAVTALRREYATQLERAEASPDGRVVRELPSDGPRRRAVQAARSAVIGMRSNGTIGDTAFHQIEEELDWMEMSASARDGG